MQVQRGVEGFAYVVGGLEQGPGGVGQFADEGGVVLGGGLGGDGFQVGVQRGGLAVQLGVCSRIRLRYAAAGLVSSPSWASSLIRPFWLASLRAIRLRSWAAWASRRAAASAADAGS